jgi:predicted Zn-dependent protease
MDAPVVRLALARIHLDRKEPDAALRQLLVARRHTPDDAEVNADVARAYEMKSDAEGVCSALAFSLWHLPRQPDLYPRLAERLSKLGRPGDAERALTGLAEYAPNDADGHRRLAGLRRTAGRHDDAVVQWRQVVRIRAAEIDGWMELARSLARAGRKDEAHATLDEFLRTPAGAGQRKAVEAVSREIGGS